MKRTLCLLALLLAAALMGLCAAHSWLNGSGEAVTLTRTDRAGDPSALEGLALTLRYQRRYSLFWTVRAALGGEAEARPETAVRFMQSDQPPQSGQQTEYLELMPQVDFGVGSSGELSLTEDSQGQERLVREVASRTGPGETRTETLRYADYYAAYPLQAYLRLNEWAVLAGEEETDLFWYEELLGPALAESFAFPVGPDHQVEVTAAKDDSGAVRELSVFTLKGGPDVRTVSAVTAEACYFTFAGSLKPQNVDFGLYRLPLTRGEERTTVFPDQVSLAFPLDPAAEPLLLSEDPEAKRLLLLTRREEDCLLTVLDGETLAELQSLTLPLSAQTLETEAHWQDGCLLLRVDDGLALLERTADGYHLALTAALGRDFPRLSDQPERFDFHWDGARLAVAALGVSGGDPVWLRVYPPAGLAYAGSVSTSVGRLNGGVISADEYVPLSLGKR